jgi:hypothetical protein
MADVMEELTLPSLRPKRAGSRMYASYELRDTDLGMGGSFGNSALWIDTKNTGAIGRVYCIDNGHDAIGSILLRYAIGDIGLGPDGTTRNFEIHPAYQRCTFSLGGVVSVSETTFLPLASPDLVEDPPYLYQVVDLTNLSDEPQNVRVTAFARMKGSLPNDVIVEYNKSAHAFVAHNEGTPRTARFFGVSPDPTAHATTPWFGNLSNIPKKHDLDGSHAARGDVLACLQAEVTIPPRGAHRVTFNAAAYALAPKDAIKKYHPAHDGGKELEQTIESLDEALSIARVLTPDGVLNRGIAWSKVNMRRVMAHFPQGWAFTNDPGNSSAIVVRDAAWFIYGNDHFMPAFSRILIEKIANIQYENGYIPEYYDGLTGRLEDYGLNINDGTPLYIMAVHHHYRATGSIDWVRKLYPAVSRAAHYLLTQRDDRGLVFCSANDPRGNVWAIAGWRNIIPKYAINGATTEINAECVAALRMASHIALELGDLDAHTTFSKGSHEIRKAMDTHLINPDTGLYYLNIDVDGRAHSDITGDLIFPVMFGACDEDMAFRIVSRLNDSDFVTPAGLRTISSDDPKYEPSAYSGLMGGVWPGLTWWYAFAAARYRPDAMVTALRSSFEHFAVAPRTNNTVPGQFSEWFGGESLTNMGMRLSPWEPPRFLWATIEGVCGLTLTGDEPKINPLIPDDWKWLAIRDLQYHGGRVSYVLTRQAGSFVMYSTAPLETDYQIDLYDEDVSDQVTALSGDAVVVAFRRADSIMVMLGTTASHTTHLAINLSPLLQTQKNCELRLFDSSRDGWDERPAQPARDVGKIALLVPAEGYRLVEVRFVD